MDLMRKCEDLYREKVPMSNSSATAHLGLPFEEEVQSQLHTHCGTSKIYYFQGPEIRQSCYALVVGHVSGKNKVLVRIQSQCTIGEVFGSLQCDCRQQLEKSIEQLHANHKTGGILIYLFQEGMGHGHLAKARAMELVAKEDTDMATAYERLGFPKDERRYDLAFAVLKHLGVKGPIRLLTNNPDKIRQLEDLGIKVERVPLQVAPDNYNMKCLWYKWKKLGHLFNLPISAVTDRGSK